MLNKDRIVRVLVYDANGKLVIATKSVFFPKDFFKIKGQDLVMLKGSGFPLIATDEKISVVFEYIDGSRIKCNTVIDLCTEYQINFHVGKGELLSERRKSFKISIDLDGLSPFYIRGEEMFAFDEPAIIHFVNINLGGVFFTSESDFELGDCVMLNFLDDEMQILSEIIRVQHSDGGEIEGYGCRFLDMNAAQEERLTRFIFDCQVIERERKRAKERLF